MTAIHFKPARLPNAARSALFALAALLTGCCSIPPEHADQRIYKSADAAVEALAAAAEAGDTEELLAIFGPAGHEVLSSGDPVADRTNREVFVVAIRQGWTIEKLDGDYRGLIVGHEAWPFPIPLVDACYGWRFDTEAGKYEVLARRIGRNELAAISTCRTYVIAQREYAAQAHDGAPAGAYAQKVRSTPGKHDGLYWPATAGQKPSPLSELAAQAESEGYSTNAPAQPRPFHGYYFRILTGQGDAAPGGAKSYIVDGRLTAGHALIACPAAYGNGGVMSFIVSHDGFIYEADLGPDTAKTAAAITQYNPDRRWRIAE